MNAPELLVDRVGAIVTLTLNRPQRLNALSESLARALTAALVRHSRGSSRHPQGAQAGGGRAARRGGRRGAQPGAVL